MERFSIPFLFCCLFLCLTSTSSLQCYECDGMCDTTKIKTCYESAYPDKRPACWTYKFEYLGIKSSETKQCIIYDEDYEQACQRTDHGMGSCRICFEDLCNSGETYPIYFGLFLTLAILAINV